MFGVNLAKQRPATGSDVQRKFSAELRQLIRRFTAGHSRNKKLRNRTILARINFQLHSYFLVRAPRKSTGLTPQQRRITLLVVQGLTNKEIAKRLKIEASTVTTHLSKIFLKLDIHTRVALVRHYLLSV